VRTTVEERGRVGAAPQFARATWLAAAVVVVGGGLGWLWLRHWGRVPFSVPSIPWYHCFPFYAFPHPVLAPGWALAALPLALGVTAAVVAMAHREVPWPLRLAASAAAVFVLALAVSALGGGPRAWWAPFDYAGEYPAGAHLVGAIPSFLRRFPVLLPALPTHAQGHPAGAMVLYGLVARIRPGLAAAAAATVAVGALGAVGAGALARDELGARGARLTVATVGAQPRCRAVRGDLGRCRVRHSAGAGRAGRPPGPGAALVGLDRRGRRAAVDGIDADLLRRAVARVPADPGGGQAAERAGVGGPLGCRHGRGRARAGRGAVAGHRLRPPGRAARGPPRLPGRSRLGPAAGAALDRRRPARLRRHAGHTAARRAGGACRGGGARARLGLGGRGGTCGPACRRELGLQQGEVERIFQFLVPLVLVPVARQLLDWRVRLPVVAALLLAQTLAVQVLFATRW
jgi:hypothetical protein